MTTESKIYTIQVSTKGDYKKVDELLDTTFVDDKLYAIQILGNAKLDFTSATPGEEGFTICFPQPFTYEKKADENLYLKTGNSRVILTVAGEFEVEE